MKVYLFNRLIFKSIDGNAEKDIMRKIRKENTLNENYILSEFEFNHKSVSEISNMKENIFQQYSIDKKYENYKLYILNKSKDNSLAKLGITCCICSLIAVLVLNPSNGKTKESKNVPDKTYSEIQETGIETVSNKFFTIKYDKKYLSAEIDDSQSIYFIFDKNTDKITSYIMLCATDNTGDPKEFIDYYCNLLKETNSVDDSEGMDISSEDEREVAVKTITATDEDKNEYDITIKSFQITNDTVGVAIKFILNGEENEEWVKSLNEAYQTLECTMTIDEAEKVIQQYYNQEEEKQDETIEKKSNNDD